MSSMSLPARVRAKLKVFGLAWTIRTTPRDDLMRIGSVYGGWWVPRRLLSPESVVYLAGVGEDVTFDLGLIDEVGCDVWSMDPTPRAIAFVSEVMEPKFHFLDEGLWSEDTELRFYEPANPEHVSHSAVNAQRTNNYFTARCRSVRSFMKELGHDRLDLLKLDIEGAEVAVIEDLLKNGPLPLVLCVEFDAPERISQTRGRVAALTAAGYVAVKVEGLNATFVRG